MHIFSDSSKILRFLPSVYGNISWDFPPWPTMANLSHLTSVIYQCSLGSPISTTLNQTILSDSGRKSLSQHSEWGFQKMRPVQVGPSLVVLSSCESLLNIAI